MYYRIYEAGHMVLLIFIKITIIENNLFFMIFLN